MKHPRCPVCGAAVEQVFIPAIDRWTMECMSGGCLSTKAKRNAEMAQVAWNVLCTSILRQREIEQYSRCGSCKHKQKLASEVPCRGCMWCYPDESEVG